MKTLERATILTVSQLTKSIKTILEKEYRFVRICGEISNLSTPFSGHSYFTLKDSSAQIRGVLFKQQKRFVDLRLKNGQEVICFGRVAVYEPRGEYQLIIDSVELFGTGKLQIAFEQLKQKLSEEGYFDQNIKKKIPDFAGKIAVISSPTGAAFQDFLKIVQLRKSSAHIQLLPVRVQGEKAPAEIAKAITAVDMAAGHEVIVLCRGGGSLEDLWAFNDERVATAIYKASTPVVTGVGHEIDFTIADFCADLRCPTPTAVAERLVPDNSVILKQVHSLKSRLVNRIQQKFTYSNQQVLHNVRMLGNVATVLNDANHRLQLSKSYLIQAMSKLLGEKELRLMTTASKLQTNAPIKKISIREERLAHLKKLLINHTRRIVERKDAEFAQQAALLHSVSPLATLGRGYSITRKYDQNTGDHQVIRNSCEVSAGDRVNVLLHAGEIDCQVLDKTEIE